MLFNSFEFLFLFLPLAIVGYYFLVKLKYWQFSKVWLVAASLGFYSYWNINFLPVLVFSLLFNYTVSHFLIKGRNVWLLTFGIAVNVGLLGYFKYYDFFLENLQLVTGGTYRFLKLALPLGISFFTFQQIAFLVDHYKHKAKLSGFIDYSLFVCFFPQLIAGPIVHHGEMMPQFEDLSTRRWNDEHVAKGMFIFINGLAKKVLVADTLAVWASAGFDDLVDPNVIEAWFSSLAYTFQLYFDFSGYTDMAIGLGLIFNIKLPFNFNSPYKAVNIQDFWRRWHMTLSRFLRDYLYIPFGGSRKGEGRTYVNLFLTFLIGGIWHGAGWTFVFWGVLHGIATIIHRIWGRFGIQMNKGLAWVTTFLFVNFAWVFFRAANWGDATKIIKAMFGLGNSGMSFGLERLGGDVLSYIWLMGALVLVLFLPNSNTIQERLQPRFGWGVTMIALGVVAILSMYKVSEFIYFGF